MKSNCVQLSWHLVHLITDEFLQNHFFLSFCWETRAFDTNHVYLIISEKNRFEKVRKSRVFRKNAFKKIILCIIFINY